MVGIRINLFGRLAVFVDDKPVFVGVPQTKPLELFVYLLAHRRRTHPREILATLLWADTAPKQARKNLRKVLFTLQHFLAETLGPHGPPLLLIEQDWVAINSSVELVLDVALFEQAYALSQQKVGTRLEAEAVQQMANAVMLYEGELLAGLYSDWCLIERERLENMYLELLHTLMLHFDSERSHEQAIAYGLEILRQDPANERTYCKLMRLYYISGNRTAALHLYKHCVTALANELGVEPCKSTNFLYEQICRDDLALAQAVPEPAYLRHLEPALGAEPQTHLQQVRQELQGILRQVQDEIHRVERLLQN